MNIFQSLWLYWKGFIRRSYSKFFSKKCVKCSSFKNDGELMLMVVQTLKAITAMFSVDLTGRARERVALFNKDPVCRIRFTNWSTNLLKAFLFYQIFHVNFLQFGYRLTTLEVSFQYFVQAYSDPFRKCQTRN